MLRSPSLRARTRPWVTASSACIATLPSPPWLGWAAISSAPPHGQACRFWPATTTTPPTSSVAAQAPAPVRRSRCWTDWVIGGSRKTQSGVLLPLTASGQEFDKSEGRVAWSSKAIRGGSVHECLDWLALVLYAAANSPAPAPPRRHPGGRVRFVGVP